MLRNRSSNPEGRYVENAVFEPQAGAGYATHGAPSMGDPRGGREGASFASGGRGQSQSPTEQVLVVRHTGDPNEVGIRGRHKTCLYGALGLFGLLAIINIGLIVYLYQLLDMSVTGVGVLRVSDNRVTVNGELVLRNGLVTDVFRSKASACAQFTSSGSCASVAACSWLRPSDNEPAQCVGYALGDGLTVASVAAVQLTSGSTAQLLLTPTGIAAAAPSFQVSTANGTQVLEMNETHCLFQSDTTVFTSPAGVVLSGALETTSVTSSSESGAGLTLTSVAHGVEVRAGTDVSITAVRDVTVAAPSVEIAASGVLSLSATDVTLVQQAQSTFPGVLCVCGVTSSVPGKLVVSATDSCDDVATRC